MDTKAGPKNLVLLIAIEFKDKALAIFFELTKDGIIAVLVG